MNTEGRLLKLIPYGVAVVFDTQREAQEIYQNLTSRTTGTNVDIFYNKDEKTWWVTQYCRFAAPLKELPDGSLESKPEGQRFSTSSPKELQWYPDKPGLQEMPPKPHDFSESIQIIKDVKDANR